MNLRKTQISNNRPPSATNRPPSTTYDYAQNDLYNPNNQVYYEQQTQYIEQKQGSQQFSGSQQTSFQQQNFYDPLGSTYATSPQSNTNNNLNQQQMFQNQPQLFYPNSNNPAVNLLSDPMAAMAVKYSSHLADQGKAYVAQNVDRWFSISKLKYYFAVDTSYVGKKLMLLSFPFFNKDWSVKYDQNIAVPPKLDKNAPDMYIPIMAYVTYILIVGVILGTQGKFTPELLGINASSALGWFLIEIVIILISLQILSIRSSLKTFDVIAYCGYKYIGMIFCLVAGLLFSKTAYTAVLVYMSISIFYFMRIHVSHRYLQCPIIQQLKNFYQLQPNPCEKTSCEEQ